MIRFLAAVAFIGIWFGCSHQGPVDVASSGTKSGNAMVCGTILSPTGLPSAGATPTKNAKVFIVRSDYNPFANMSEDGFTMDSTFSDSQGRYAFSDLPLGQYNITAVHQGLRSFHGSLNVDGSSDIPSLMDTLCQPGSVSGEVQNAYGSGLSGVNLCIMGTPFHARSISVYGVFTLDSLASGTYTMLLKSSVNRFFSIETLITVLSGNHDTLSMPLTLVEKSVQCLFAGADKALWAGTSGGLARFHEGLWNYYTSAAGLSHDNITSLMQDTQGRLWAGTIRGISVFNGISWSPFRTFTPIDFSEIKCLASDFKGRVWIGLGSYLYFSRDSLLEMVEESFKWPSNTITAITGDSSGVWIGTTSGLHHLVDTVWSSFTVQEGLPNNSIRCLALNTTGEVFAGTENGIAVFNGTTWTNYTVQDGLPSNTITALYIDSKSVVWAGTANGLCRKADTMWTVVHDPLLNNQRINCITSFENKIWVGWSNGLCYYNGILWQGVQ